MGMGPDPWCIKNEWHSDCHRNDAGCLHLGRTRQVYTTPGHSWEPQDQSGWTKRLSGRRTPRRSAGTAGVSLRSTGKARSSQTLATGSGGRTEAPSGSCLDAGQSWAQRGPRGEAWEPLVAATGTLVQSPGESPHGRHASSGVCREPEPATQARAAWSAQGGLTAGVTDVFNTGKPTDGLTIKKNT